MFDTIKRDDDTEKKKTTTVSMADATVAHGCSEVETSPSLEDLFEVPEADISYNGYRMVTISPTTTGVTPMEFVVMSRPFGYMLMDLHPASSDDVCLYSYILRDEGLTRCYKYKKKDGDEQERVGKSARTKP